MNNFIAACLALIALELAVVVAFLVVTLYNVNRTAQAIEVLAYRVDQEIVHLGGALRSGWTRALGSAVTSLVGGWWSGRHKQD